MPSLSSSKVKIAAESNKSVIREFARIIGLNAAIPLTQQTHKIKGKLALEAAEVFTEDINDNPSISRMPMDEAIKAADFADPALSVGLLSGSLVLQRSLELLQYEYPILDSILTDFSGEPGLFKQTENTRIVLKPAVQTYDNTADSSGRPKGWVTVSPAQTVDVPITLDEYVGVPIVFGVATLSATLRNLFAETAPQALYALGGHFVDKLTALFTAANYNAYKGTSATGGEAADGSHEIVVDSTADMFRGQEIIGTGIPTKTYIARVIDGTNAVMTQKATATNTGLTFTLSGGRVPITYATYAKALADFNMVSLGEIGAAFDGNEVPERDRAVLLNAFYYNRLGQDTTINQFFAAMRSPEIITKGRLPELQGFIPQKAPWFPSTNSRVGFAYHRSAAIVKTRLPLDFFFAVAGGVPGSVTTVTAPGGISVSLVQYVNLQGNYAEWRPEIMLGAAVAERRAGLVLTSS